MFKKLTENTFIHTLILFTIAILTFLPTLEMFFYLDEFGSLYEFTHGNFNGTIFTARVFQALFYLFGTNPLGYYATGTVIFALSVVIFYFFVKSLLKNKLLAFFAGLVYATTPVGVSTVFMLWTFVPEGGYPLNIALILLLYVLLRFFQVKKIYFFLAAALIFMYFLELEPRRAFIFFPIIFLFDYFVNFRKIVILDIKFIIRQSIFFALFVIYYRYVVTLTGILSTRNIVLQESGGYFDWQTKVIVGLNALFDGQPLVTLSNILAGPFLLFPNYLLSLVAVKNTYFWTSLILFIAGVLVVLAWRVKRELGLMSLFALGWIYINIFSIYVFSSPGIGDTTHRTLSIAAPGYALFIAISGYSLYIYLKNKIKGVESNWNRLFAVVLVLFLSLSFLATRYHFEKFNSFRSRPAHAFFKDLKRFYPEFPPNSLLYVQTSKDPHIRNRLTKIYGGSNYGAGATVAIFYPKLTMEQIDLVRDIKDVEKFIASDSAKINNVFAFYYDEKGLSDRTAEFRYKYNQKD